VTDADFFPLLVLDAVLTGAKGVNLWTSFRNPPQRSARLYRALVDRRLASSVFGALLPTEDPFLYSISVTATDGVPLDVIEETALSHIEAVRREGITPLELKRALHQLRARLVFESDSVTNIAHQLGYFETVANLGVFERVGRSIEQVTLDDVGRVASRVLAAANRTVGWFLPTADAVPPAAAGIAAAEHA
jgi:zinc protease